MNFRPRIWMFALAVTGVLLARAAGDEPRSGKRPPNIVLIFADDLGYADVGCFGAKGYLTPNIDRLAKQGVRFTDFYVPQAVCSASRAGLLTGCYSNRVGILGALGPKSQTGINDSERTVAQVLKPRGYATAVFGKWHLGCQPKFLPTRHGFDEYFGLPYSNDMWPKHPTDQSYPALPLIDEEKPVQLNPDQRQLTTWYTEHAVSFIERNRSRPFFLYVPHSMCHVPLHVSDKFAGKTERGLFGDVIEEIDWSVGRILGALKKNGLERNTLVIFTADNGPWLSYGDHAGSAEPLREGKGTTFDGGVREPFVARWPGRIRPGTVCHEPAMTIDLLPTFARLARAEVPQDRIIDGRDIWPLISGEKGAKSPHQAYYFYWGGALQAVRSGKWKLHFRHDYRSPGEKRGAGGKPAPYVTRHIGKELFDLEADPGESRDVAAEHPEVVRRLDELAEKAREDLGDTATGRKGSGLRAPGHV